MATPNIYGELPPEILTGQAELERRQKIADAMLQQGMTPLGAGRMVGNTFVPPHWLEGVAKLGQAYAGNMASDAARKGRLELGEQYNKMYGDAIAKYLSTKQGAPASSETIVDEQAAGGEGQLATINAPAVAGNRERAVVEAMLSRFPGLQKIAAMDYAQALKENQPFDLPAGGVRYGPDGKIIASAPFKPELGKGFKIGDTRQMRVGRSIVTQEYQADGTWKKIAEGDVDKPASMTTINPAPVTPVQIVRDGKEIVVDGRTGRVIGDSPKLSDRNKMEAKRQFNMQGIGATIQQAEDLLSGIERLPGGVTKAGEKPTGSGVGAAVDFLGGLVGMSPAGSVQAQQLEAVGGALTSKMPRMEGPQSDKDTMLYKQMAAMVGDRTVPVDRRKAALQTVKELWAKYERLNPDAFAGGDGSANDWSIKPIP